MLGPEHPRTYDELVMLFNSLDWNNGYDADRLNYGDVHSSTITKKVLKRPRSGDNRPRSKTAKNTTTCYHFNKAEGCKKSNGASVKDKFGMVHEHVCNKEDNNGGICGSRDHGAAGH